MNRASRRDPSGALCNERVTMSRTSRRHARGRPWRTTWAALLFAVAARGRPWPATWALLFALAACGSPDASRSANVTVTDSAGIVLRISAGTDATFATVDAEPELSIGGPDASGAAQFFNIQGIHLDDAGQLWVANRGSNEVRVFAADGTYWKTIGRTGRGPGEFTQLRLLGPVDGGRIALWDDGNPRLTLVTPTGAVDTVLSFSLDGRPPHAFATFPDGELLLRATGIVESRALEPGALLADTATLLRYDPADGSSTTLARIGGPDWIWDGRMQVPVAFTIRSAFATDATGALHVAEGPAFRIRYVQDGRHTETYGVERSPRPVSAADIDAYRALYETHMSPGPVRDAYIEALNHAGRPDQLPAYGTLVIDDAGNMWAQVYAPDPLQATTWDVFDSGRTWRGSVRLPPGLIVHAIRNGRIAGVWRDADGTEHVRVYRFTPAQR